MRNVNYSFTIIVFS